MGRFAYLYGRLQSHTPALDGLISEQQGRNIGTSQSNLLKVLHFGLCPGTCETIAYPNIIRNGFIQSQLLTNSTLIFRQNLLYFFYKKLNQISKVCRLSFETSLKHEVGNTVVPLL